MIYRSIKPIFVLVLVFLQFLPNGLTARNLGSPGRIINDDLIAFLSLTAGNFFTSYEEDNQRALIWLSQTSNEEVEDPIEVYSEVEITFTDKAAIDLFLVVCQVKIFG